MSVTISGLRGSGLVLQDGTEELSIPADGTYTFSTALSKGDSYSVSVRTQPIAPTQRCTVLGPIDAPLKPVGEDAIAAVSVSCKDSVATYAFVTNGNLPPQAQTNTPQAETNTLKLFALDSEGGRLASPQTIATSSAAYAVVTSPDGKFVYVPHFFSGSIDAYSANQSDGTLSPIPGAPYQLSIGSRTAAITPNGKYLFVVNYAAARIEPFSVNLASGSISATLPPVITGIGPVDAKVSLNGKHLYVANFVSQSVSAYAINEQSGDLVELSGSPYAMPNTARSLALDPRGKFLYVPDDHSGVFGFVRDAETGTLTQIPGSPFPAGVRPTAAAFDSEGRYLYVCNADSNDISAYRVDPSSGVLTQLSHAPFATDRGPQSIAVEPTGKFLYTTNQGIGTISAFTIDASTGSLTPVQGSPYAAPGASHMAFLVP